jgi:hypothetical protein
MFLRNTDEIPPERTLVTWQCLYSRHLRDQLRTRLYGVTSQQTAPYPVQGRSTGYSDKSSIDGTHTSVNGMCFRVNFTGSDSWGSQDDEGAWVGLLGMLTEGEVDLMVCHPTVTVDRRAAVLFLHPTLQSWYSSWCKSDSRFGSKTSRNQTNGRTMLKHHENWKVVLLHK